MGAPSSVILLFIRFNAPRISALAFRAMAFRAIAFMALAFMALALTAGSVATAQSGLPPASPSPHEVDPLKELVIVDDNVVRDPRAEGMGPWSAGYLFSQLLPPTATIKEKSDLVKTLVKSWFTDQVMPNGQISYKRDSAEFIILCPWINESYNNKDCQGDLDLAKAPFRLLGIVNRVDIGSHTPDGKGEARFVYALLDAHTDEQNTIGGGKQMTLIFEYNMTPAPFSRYRWSLSWHHLGLLPCPTKEGCESYRKYLTQLTKSFSDYQGEREGLPLGTYLSQVRASELQLDSPWQWREFLVAKGDEGSRLKFQQTYVVQTPGNKFNGNEELGAWIMANREAIKKGTYRIPEKFRGADSDTTGRTLWRFPEVTEPIRRAFALNTCNGCHVNETEPLAQFYHIAPLDNLIGKQRLSPYMFDVAIPKRLQIFEKILAKKLK